MATRSKRAKSAAAAGRNSSEASSSAAALMEPGQDALHQCFTDVARTAAATVDGSAGPSGGQGKRSSAESRCDTSTGSSTSSWNIAEAAESGEMALLTRP